MSDKTSNYSTIGKNTDDIKYFATWKQKKAVDFKLPKAMFDYYDIYRANINPERQDRIDENYGLFNGRWKKIERMNPDLSFSAGQEKVSLKGAKLRHYPYIDGVARAIVAEMGMRPFVPMLVDTSSQAKNQRERRKLEKLGTWLQHTTINGIRESVTKKYAKEYGVKDIYSLNGEEQMQMKQDIQKRMQEAGRDLDHYLKSDRLPTEEQGQTFLNFLMKEADMLNEFIDGWRDAVIIGEEYHMVRIIGGKPYQKSLNPKGITYELAGDSDYVEDGEWARYVQHTTPSDMLRKYGDSLEKKDIKKIEDMYGPLLGRMNHEGRDLNPNPDIESKILHDIADGKIDQSEINPKTREGQQKLMNIYQRYGENIEDYGIKETYITWKWARNIKEVTRIVNGKPEQFYFDEYYEFAPQEGDIKIVDRTVPQTWHGVKIGELDGIYLNFEPVPYQYNNLDDPFETKLTIYGAKYNHLRGNAENKGLIDGAKTWNYRINVLMRRIEEYEATNVGKVLLGTANMKPHGWTWQQFFMSMRYGKFVPTNTHGEHVQQADAQFFKSIDLSSMMDIAGALQQLEYLERRLANSMYYNPSKMGSISPYLTASNNQQNLQASDKQLFEYYRRHTNIRERVMQAMLDTARVAYNEGGLITSVLLDDFSRAELETNEDTFKYASLALRVVDDYREYEKLQNIQSAIADFIMKGYGDPEDLIKVFMADSNAEVIRIAEDITRKKRESEKAQMESQANLAQQNQQLQERMLQLKNQYELAKIETENKFRAQIADIEKDKYANQYDIDKNKINDRIQEAQLKIDSEERIEAEKQAMEKYKADQRAELEKMKINKMK